MPETPAPSTTTVVPLGLPVSTGRGPACAAIKSHDRIAVMTRVDPPTSPNCSRKRRRVSPPRGFRHHQASTCARRIYHATRTWNCTDRAYPPTAVSWPKVGVPNCDCSVVKRGLSNRFSTSARREMVCAPMRCDFWTLRSTFRCAGVRRSGSVRGALPNVYAGAAVNAAGLIQFVSRSSSDPLVASSTPGTRFGR